MPQYGIPACRQRRQLGRECGQSTRAADTDRPSANPSFPALFRPVAAAGAVTRSRGFFVVAST